MLPSTLPLKIANLESLFGKLDCIIRDKNITTLNKGLSGYEMFVLATINLAIIIYIKYLDERLNQ